MCQAPVKSPGVPGENNSCLHTFLQKLFEQDEPLLKKEKPIQLNELSMSICFAKVFLTLKGRLGT